MGFKRRLSVKLPFSLLAFVALGLLFFGIICSNIPKDASSLNAAELPDFTGSFLKLDALKEGVKLKASFEVKNIGSDFKQAFKVSFYLSQDGVTKGEQLKSALMKKGMKAGKKKKISLSYTSSSSLLGKFIIAEIDSEAQVEESDETNNTRSRIIVPKHYPIANAGLDQTVAPGASVQLDGSGSTDPDGDPLSYAWSIKSIPQGSSAALSDASEVKPIFTVDLPGSYVVELIVRDPKYESFPDSVTISTENSAPVANAGPDRTAPLGSLVTLDGSGSTDVDGDSLSYSWSFESIPNGSGASLTDPLSVAPSFTVDLPGNYTAKLLVGDGTLPSDPDSVVISTENSRPVADAGEDQTVEPGETAALDGSGSKDVDGDPLSYDWSILSKPAGSGVELSDAAIVNPVFIPDLPGLYVVQLIVDDGKIQSDPDTVSITRENSPPVADAGASRVVLVGNAVALDGSKSSDPDNDPLSYSWTLTAKPEGSAASLLNADKVNPSFTPDVAGEYEAQLIVGDGSLQSIPDSVGITAANLIATVPDVAGLPKEEAEALITSAGLAVGEITLEISDTVPEGSVIRQSPGAGSAVESGSSVSLVVSLGPPHIAEVPDVVGSDKAGAIASIKSSGFMVGAIDSQHSDIVPAGNVISQEPVGGTALMQGSAVRLVISLGSFENWSPPAPEEIASEIDPTVVTIVSEVTTFLYSGENPVQTGVQKEEMAPTRIAVLRGKVFDATASPLAGVEISVLNHPEFGRTKTRADGMYDMAVNGGGPLTLNYLKAGLISAQRTVTVPWQDWLQVEDVVMIGRDSATTAIDSTLNSYQAHRATVTADTDGSRRATILFPPGTTATLGSGATLDRYTVRATEFTVGPNGPNAMPAQLPPTSAYTYAVKISLDESGENEMITFNQPVQFYVENFIGFPVGTPVPTGYYDPAKAAWIAIPDGVVIKIISEAGGIAEIDTDGDDAADNAEMSVEERTLLATLYEPGAELWRVPISHFSTIDCNYGSGPNDGATPPKDINIDISNNKSKPSSNPQQVGGSLNPESRTLTETINLVGVPFSLNYSSQRVKDGPQDIAIKLSGATLPPQIMKIYLNIQVAGRNFAHQFDPSPSLVYDFRWDGLDAYGRETNGAQEITVRIGYEYPDYFYRPISSSGRVGGFGRVRLIPTGIRARTTTILWANPLTYAGKSMAAGAFDPRGQGLGGWTLSAHHAYDMKRRAVYMGDGGVKVSDGIGAVRHLAGTGSYGYTGDGGPAKLAELRDVKGLAVGPDGAVYISGAAEVRRVDPQTGIITTVAGDEGSGGGDPEVGLSSPSGIDVGPDGSLYISDVGNCRILRVDPQGIMTTVAGGGAQPQGPIEIMAGVADCVDEGDGGPATEARLLLPSDVAVAPEGSFYIKTAQYIRHVGTDGMITTIDQFDDVRDRDRIALGPDGSLYVSEYDACRIRRMGTDGVVTTVAGTGECDFGGAYFMEGVPATETRLESPTDIAVALDGVLYIVESLGYSFGSNNRIRRVGTDGIITTMIPGDGTVSIPEGDKGPPRVDLGNAVIACGPDGLLYFGGNNSIAVGMLQPAMPGLEGTDVILPSLRGDLLYVFSSSGKHLETRNALTNAVLFAFAYDGQGRLSAVTDFDGSATLIERDPSGNPTGIVGPYGKRTALEINDDGWLRRVTNPGGGVWNLSYSGAGGLLTQVVTPRDGAYGFQYDLTGRVNRAVDADNAETLLSSSGLLENGEETTMTSPEGIVTRYRTEYLTTGEVRVTTTFADGRTSQQRDFPDFTREITFAEGIRTTMEFGPDPRFGMQLPHLKNAATTRPDGPTTTTTLEMEVTLTDPNDLFSLQRVVQTTTVNGESRTVDFDAASRAFTRTSPEGRESKSRIDEAGRIIELQYGGLEATTFTYDASGRIAQVAQGGRTTEYEYGADGLLSGMTDPLDRTGRYERDPDGRILKQWLPDDRMISYAYDIGGMPTSLTPPAGEGYSFTWTPYGLPDVTTLPDGRTVDTEYNRDRRITVQRLTPGSTLTTGYDAFGRAVTVNFGDGNVITTGYGPDGRPSSVSAPGQNLALTWMGGMVSSESWTGLVNGSVGGAFDGFKRIVSQTVTGSDSTAYRYDDDGLLMGMKEPVHETRDFSLTRYPASGLITAASIGGISETYTHNGFGEGTGYTAGFGAAILYSASLVRDDLSRIVRKEETMEGVTTVYGYSYDLAGRLVGYSVNDAPDESYTYDERDNRTAADGASAAFDSGDRLTSQGGAPYSYDADGRLASKNAGAFATSYSYDALGRLLSVDPPGADNTVSYDYDGVGRRIRRSVNGVATNLWVYRNIILPVAELDEAGNVLTLFVYGSRPVTPDYMVRGSVVYRLITDERGSVRLVVNAQTGAVAQRIDYDPWGQVKHDSNPGFQPFGFAGGLYDPASGLVRFGVRDYDPEIGRFTAPDPIYLAGRQLNLYIYAYNDPVNAIDPSGMVRWSQVAKGGLGMVGGGVTFVQGFAVFEFGAGLSGGVPGGAFMGGLPILTLGGSMMINGAYTFSAGLTNAAIGFIDPAEPGEVPANIAALIGRVAGGEKGEKMGDYIDFFAGLATGRAIEKGITSFPAALNLAGDIPDYIDFGSNLWRDFGPELSDFEQDAPQQAP